MRLGAPRPGRDWGEIFFRSRMVSGSWIEHKGATSRHALPCPVSRRLRDHSLPDFRRGRSQQRSEAEPDDRRPAGHCRPGEQRAGEGGAAQLRVSASSAAHHDQSGAGRCKEGRFGLRSAHGGRHPGRLGMRPCAESFRVPFSGRAVAGRVGSAGQGDALDGGDGA